MGIYLSVKRQPFGDCIFVNHEWPSPVCSLQVLRWQTGNYNNILLTTRVDTNSLGRIIST